MELRTRILSNGLTAYFIDYREGGLRRRKVLKGIHTAKAAQVAFADFVARYGRGMAAMPTDENLTLRKTLDAYIESKRAVCLEAQVETLEARARMACEHFDGDRPVRTLTPRAVDGWRRELSKRGDCPWTINRKVLILKAAIRLAIRQGKIPSNPIEHVEPVSDPRRDVARFLTEEEVERLLSVLRDGELRTITRKNGRRMTYRAGRNPAMWRLCLFLANTGARRGEALALRWGDVDLGRGLVTLMTTKRAARGRKAVPRTVPMNAALAELFEGMKRGAADQDVFSDLSRHGLLRKFSAACTAAGLGHVRLHDLRHAFGSLLVASGTPLPVVQRLMGHTSIVTTQRYLHVRPGHDVEAVAALNLGATKPTAKVVSVGG